MGAEGEVLRFGARTHVSNMRHLVENVNPDIQVCCVNRSAGRGNTSIGVRSQGKHMKNPS